MNRKYIKILLFLIIPGFFALGLNGCGSCDRDELRPQITITSPSGTTVPGSAIITITASAQDRNKFSKIPSSINKVEFYVDGTEIGEDNTTPYECAWDTSGLKHNTTHTVTVKAYDNEGNIGIDSKSFTINVEWTIFMYLDGHNNLGPYIYTELVALYNLTSTAGINIVVLEGHNRSDPISYLYYFHNGTSEILAQGNYNFGDPAVLQNFLTYGAQNFRAKKYMLILFDHGSGWRKRTDSSSTRDICFDDIYNDSLTIPELKSALQPVVSILGKKIDLIYLDACVMGNVEVDYELRDIGSYIVSSEATGWIGGTTRRYYEILNRVISNPTMSPIELGVTTAQIYFNAYTIERTIAVKDLSKINYIIKDIYYFAHYLRDCLPNSASLIMNLRNQTQSFSPYSNYPEVYIDLYQYANFIANNTSYNELKESALNLMNSITSSIIYCAYSGYSSAKGYSIWFPEDSYYYNDGYPKYSALDFSQSSYGQEWSLFLDEEFSALGTGKENFGLNIGKE